PKRSIPANLTHAQFGKRVPDMNDKAELTGACRHERHTGKWIRIRRATPAHRQIRTSPGLGQREPRVAGMDATARHRVARLAETNLPASPAARRWRLRAGRQLRHGRRQIAPNGFVT